MHVHPDELVMTWELARMLVLTERTMVTGIEESAILLKPSITRASTLIVDPERRSAGKVMFAKIGLGRHSIVTFVTAVWYRSFVAVRLTR
jgi:hypothetical protein